MSGFGGHLPIIVERPYSQEPKEFPLKAFAERKHIFVLRPPYQRKNVWTTSKKEALIDSFFRRHYVPSIVLREVHTPKDEMRWEVVDGQQRILAIQEFFKDMIRLPRTLRDLTEEAGLYYNELSPLVREHLEEQTISATVLGGITDPQKKAHQKLVTEAFWRLQQGESLSYMEVEHSKLYSAARSFVVKHADDISFDYENYLSLDSNKDRHPFFSHIPIDNDRLQHLAILARFLMFEFAAGPTDVGTASLRKFIDEWTDKDLEEFSRTEEAKRCLKTLDRLSEIFRSDPATLDGFVPELEREYLILSVYLLARRLVQGSWTFGKKNYEAFRKFVQRLHQRWVAQDEIDAEMLQFRDQRQQNEAAVRTRDILIAKWFFEENPGLDRLDERRQFNYAERITIYRKNHGLCQICLKEGQSEEDARVPWREFDADHLKAWSKGGLTTVENGQVLCRHHNRRKGAS